MPSARVLKNMSADKHAEVQNVTDETGSKGQLMSVLGADNIGVTDEQAKAIQSVATFGTTVVTESGALVQYLGRVLGTIPHDAVGLVLGDPLGFVRTAIAAQYDLLLTKIFE